VIALLALGGAAGADRTAVGQTLLAHPAVAAPLAGWIVGAPSEGLWLGLCMGVLSLRAIPAGQERPRDWTTVAVAIPLAVGSQSSSWQWGAALLLGLLLARPLGLAIEAVRALALRFLQRAREATSRGELPPVERVHFSFALLHFVRGVVMTAVAALVLRWAVSIAASTADVAATKILWVVWWSAPLVGLGSFLAGRRRGWLFAGLALGMVFLLAGGVR